MSLRLGIDTGGTFTDFVRLGPGGLSVLKLTIHTGIRPRPSWRAIADLRHDAPAIGRDSRIDGRHQRRARAQGRARRAPCDQGFEDVLRIGRQTRPELYNIFVPLPRPLVDPALTFGVRERLDAQGQVARRRSTSMRSTALADRLREHADIVAVCLLHSYANPAHERQVAGLLRDRGLRVCTSHEVLPEYREFERWSTTVVNAYVTPLIDGLSRWIS